MNLAQIIEKLNLKVLTDGGKDFSQITPTGGYASDLLSCVIAGAKQQNIWVTLQAHSNIVAVAALLDLCAIVITENAIPDDETTQKAREENIVILLTPEPTFSVVGKLWELGIKNG